MDLKNTNELKQGPMFFSENTAKILLLILIKREG